MNDQPRRTEGDPVLAGWNRFRSGLRAHARPINGVAVLVWIALLVVTIVDNWHAYLGVATVFFGLSVVVNLAAPQRNATGPSRGQRGGCLTQRPCLSSSADGRRADATALADDRQLGVSLDSSGNGGARVSQCTRPNWCY